MEAWFPAIVLFCGVFLQLALQTPKAAEKIAEIHPIPGSYQRIDVTSWVFIIVGSLWGLQDLLV
jgi:hypothetical protein